MINYGSAYVYVTFFLLTEEFYYYIIMYLEILKQVLTRVCLSSMTGEN